MKWLILICGVETLIIRTLNTGAHRVCQIQFALGFSGKLVNNVFFFIHAVRHENACVPVYT